MTWLAGAERIENARNRGGTYITDPDVPWRFVGHTTEVIPSSLSGARAMAERHEYPPHLWAWREQDWVGQTVPLDRSAFALYHASTDPHTNKMKAIQVEIIGRAGDSPNQPDEHWEWIGRRVLRPIVEAGYPINLHIVAPTTGSDGYGERGRVRMSWAAWRNFSGVCCHANVPGNSHWDIGAGRLDLIANAARHHQEDDLDATERQMLEEVHRSIVKREQGTAGGLIHDYSKSTLLGVRQLLGRDLDAATLAEELATRLPSTQGPVKVTDLEEAMRNVLGSLDEP